MKKRGCTCTNPLPPVADDRMPHLNSVLGLVLAVATAAVAQPVPADLSALAETARLDSPIVGWCKGEFKRRGSPAYAVASGAPSGGGRYLVLESDATVTELATFTGSADLSCYTPADARRLHGSIQQSETIEGRIVPRWRTTVVCAFVADTQSVCWQYSPNDRVFVQIGGWVT
jgi:hypothetical protein